MENKDHPKSSWLTKAYWGLVKAESFLGHFLLLVIRLYWGALLVITGLGKFAHIHGVAEFFGSLDIPAPLFSAYLVATVEFLGGISLFLGLLARIFSVFLSTVFIVAYSTAHSESLAALFENPTLFIAESPFLFLYASLIVLCFGSGLFSFDYWLEKRAFRKKI